MKFPETAKRLKYALKDMSQQELANRSGVSKASISQYVNGTNKPSNISAGKIAQVLDVNPMWLMGFDVASQSNVSPSPSRSEPQEDQKRLLEHYDKLNPTGKEKVIEYTEDLTSNPKYTQDTVLKNA